MQIRKELTSKASAQAGLSARRLTRSFGTHEVLSDVDLQIDPGTLAGLEGPNGAGKTTLLRIFATVVRPDNGEALVDGYDVSLSGARVRERIGVAFVNERSIYWRLTGRENLKLFGRTRGLTSSAADRQAETLLERLDLVEIADQWVAKLSAGQRQRLIIARAALAQPSCMLIDEPLRGLDKSGIEKMLSFLRVEADRGAAVLAVAPKLDELRASADVLFRLHDADIRPWAESESKIG